MNPYQKAVVSIFKPLKILTGPITKPIKGIYKRGKTFGKLLPIAKKDMTKFIANAALDSITEGLPGVLAGSR